MGVGIFNTLTFGGVNSGDYGIYISGEAVFNAPQRAVELVSVPGRNGDIAIDQGRFENITVEYPAGMYGDSKTDFRTRLSNFRNAVMAKRGYQRLSDTYHPDEYRAGMFIDAFEVEPEHMSEAGQFTIKFNCKPQRFLTSGETATAVTSGGTLTNPTLFASSPLLELTGYGKIGIGGTELEVLNATVGPVKVFDENTRNMTLDTTYANNGDTIYGDVGDGGYIGGASYSWTASGSISAKSITTATDWSTKVETGSGLVGSKQLHARIQYTGSFTYGTAATKTQSFTVSATVSGTTKTISISCTVTYDGDDSIAVTYTTGTTPSGWTLGYNNAFGHMIWLNSSTPIISNPPLYLDLETADAYIVDNGAPASANSAVVLPAVMPELAPGANTVTFDNTFTLVKIAARWWRV